MHQLYACICVCDFIYSNTFEVPVVHNKKLEKQRRRINFIFWFSFFEQNLAQKNYF